MNHKDYSKWRIIKDKIHTKEERIYFHEREIWFCSIGENIGFEQDGRGGEYLRPVVVIKKWNNEMCLVIPLTTNQKKGKHYFPFQFKKENIGTAIISQIRLVDAKRLEYKIGTIKQADFIVLKQKLIQLLE